MKSDGLFPGTRAQASLPVRGAWIEMLSWERKGTPGKSLPVRGAWIEMPTPCSRATAPMVAPRKGSVD